MLRVYQVIISLCCHADSLFYFFPEAIFSSESKMSLKLIRWSVSHLPCMVQVVEVVYCIFVGIPT